MGRTMSCPRAAHIFPRADQKVSISPSAPLPSPRRSQPGPLTYRAMSHESVITLPSSVSMVGTVMSLLFARSANSPRIWVNVRPWVSYSMPSQLAGSQRASYQGWRTRAAATYLSASLVRQTYGEKPGLPAAMSSGEAFSSYSFSLGAILLSRPVDVREAETAESRRRQSCSIWLHRTSRPGHDAPRQE